jgi:hypothetical protein
MKLIFYIALLCSFFLNANAQTFEQQEEKFTKVASDLLKLSKIQSIVLYEFSEIKVASLCVAIHTDYILFVKAKEKINMENMKRLNYHIMGQASLFALKIKGFEHKIIINEVNYQTGRLQNENGYFDFGYELCSKKADRVIYKD